MEYVRETYVEYFYDERKASEPTKERVQSRKFRDIVVPEGAFAFRFYDIIATTIIVDGEEMILTSKHLDQSPTYYYGGRLYSIEQIRSCGGLNWRFIEMMRHNGHEKAVRDRFGSWRLFSHDDILVSPRRT